MGDVVGSNAGSMSVKGKHSSFEEARAVARSLNIKTRKMWRERCKTEGMPKGVPAHPDGIYKTQGWAGWKNWLGTEAALPEKESGQEPKELH